jgi:hypothetical protein
VKSLILCFGFVFISSVALAQRDGPVVSGGVPPSPNLLSRLKIGAILNAEFGASDVIESIQKSENGYYLVTIDNSNCVREAFYKVIPENSGTPMPKFVARFVSLASTPVCN